MNSDLYKMAHNSVNGYNNMELNRTKTAMAETMAAQGVRMFRKIEQILVYQI